MSILSRNREEEPESKNNKTHETPIDIANEFKSFINDIENLIKNTASLTGDELVQAKIKINQRINAAKQCIADASETMFDQANKTISRTNEYVHEKPWTIIGTSALVSFVLGILLGHRDESSAK